MKWIDLHIVVILVVLLACTFSSTAFGKAPLHWLLLGSAAVMQFPLWIKALEYRKGKLPYWPHIISNEIVILLLCGLCGLATSLVRGHPS